MQLLRVGFVSMAALGLFGCPAANQRATHASAAPLDTVSSSENSDPISSDSLPDPLRLQDVVALAREGRAEIRSARALADAAAQRPAIDSRLDDPMLMAQALHIPFRTLGFSGGVMIQQSFPLSPVLSRRRIAAEHEARAFDAATGTVELDVEFEAARAFFVLHEARRLVEVLGTQLELAEQIVAATTARYAAARGTEAEVLRAETEQARLEAELAAMAAQVRAAEAMLNASIGLTPDGPIPELLIPLADELPADPVGQALESRPELEQAHARVDAADARIRISRAQFAPNGFVQLGPAYSMADGPGLMGTVGISLPIYLGWRRAGVREAQAMAGMARADVAAMETVIAGEAAATRAEVVAARIRFEAIQREVVPRARQAIDATLSSYAAGVLPLVSVLDAMEAYWMAQVDEVTAEVELGITRARLDRSVGRVP